MTTPEQHRALIRELVASYVDKPEALRLEFQKSESGEIYWMMDGHLDDEGKLIGQHGTHVDSLEYLIEQMGRAAGLVYTFRLITRGGEPKKQAPRDVITYDPSRAHALLNRLVSSLGMRAEVSVGPGSGPRNSLTFVFTFKHHGPHGRDLVGALGTLFRAIAKKDGVRFEITNNAL